MYARFLDQTLESALDFAKLTEMQFTSCIYYTYVLPLQKLCSMLNWNKNHIIISPIHHDHDLYFTVPTYATCSPYLCKNNMLLYFIRGLIFYIALGLLGQAV